MASFIAGLQKSKKSQPIKKHGEQTNVSASDTSLEDTSIEAENKRLQSKIDKNEKIMEQLNQENIEHTNIIKAKDQAKLQNAELTKEHEKLLAESKAHAKQIDKRFGIETEEKANIVAALEKQIEQIKQKCVEFDENTRKLEESCETGEVYFNADYLVIEHLLRKATEKLKETTEKLDRLKEARAKRGRIYSSVEEFMAERGEIIDLAMSRGQQIQNQTEENRKLQKEVDQLQKTVNILKQEVGEGMPPRKL